MVSQNKVEIDGFVTRDPQIKETKSGKSLCTFTLAMNHHSGVDATPRVSYIDIETWSSLADLCAQNVKKGKKVLVAGKLRQDRWEGKEGKMQSRIILVGREVRFLDQPKAEDKSEIAQVS